MRDLILDVAGTGADVSVVDSARYEVQAMAAALPDGFVVAAADEDEDGKGKEGDVRRSGISG